jgi:hypothetical protein
LKGAAASFRISNRPRQMHQPLTSNFGKAILLICWVWSAGLYSQPGYVNPISILQGKKKAVIPFHYQHNFILLDAKLFGLMPVKLIFDTGAEHIILFKREYTDVLQVPYDRRVPIMGSDLSREIFALVVRNALIQIQGLPARPNDMLVMEENYFDLDEMVGAPIAGLIGGGFFKNLVINIDYKKHKLVLIDPMQFEPPKDFISLPIHIKTNKPYVNAEASLIDGTDVQVDLLLDTGAGVPLLLHNNSNAALHLPDNYIRGKLGMGLGGYLEGFIGRIGKLSIGEIAFPFVLTSFQDIDSTWLKDKDKFRNGLVGNQLLSRFNIYLDYTHGQMYLKPYDTKQRPFNLDRSGMIIVAFGAEFNEFVVRDIADNSPAQEADIQSGDELVKIQGIPSRLFTLDAINTLLQRKPGKTIRLVIRRDHKEIHKTFILRDLI